MSTLAESLARRLELAVDITREAGRLTLDYFQREGLAVERKADDSPVTIADRQAEERLRQRIGERFPEDAVLGEELPDRPGSSGFRWVLDPIDGTKSFIHGVPLYSNLVGIECDGESVVGVVNVPALDECVFAARGQGAWYERGGRRVPARVSSVDSLAEATFLTSEVRSFDELGRRAAYDRLQQACRLARTWGDGYGYLLVATGRAELMVDPVMNLWDACPLIPILEEAGGAFTDWLGRRTAASGEGVASNARLHPDVLALLHA